jgi:hypothetical protein
MKPVPFLLKLLVVLGVALATLVASAQLTNQLPAGTNAVFYTHTISAHGGTAPYTFLFASGALPPGLTLATNGNISGTPTNAGDFLFIVTATDVQGCMGVQYYASTIAGAGYGHETGSVAVNGAAVTVTFHVTAGLSYAVQRATNVTFTGVRSNFPSVTAPPGGVLSVMDDFSDLGIFPVNACYRLRYAP